MAKELYGLKSWNFQDIIFVNKWMDWKAFAFELQYIRFRDFGKNLLIRRV